MNDIIPLISLTYKEGQLNLDISIYIILLLIILLIITGVRFLFFAKSYKMVKLNVKLGSIGEAEFIPNEDDIQIAHKLWTELITRKAAIKIVSDDVIVEIYDSWYTLFTKTRELISSIPVSSIEKESTKELIRISTEALNQGLRPHLTKWQSKYRNWYKHQENELKSLTPQEIQKNYPEYDLLVKDLKRVNDELIEYAMQLKKIVNARH